MPIYEYECPNCKKRFDVKLGVDEKREGNASGVPPPLENAFKNKLHDEDSLSIF